MSGRGRGRGRGRSVDAAARHLGEGGSKRFTAADRVSYEPPKPSHEDVTKWRKHEHEVLMIRRLHYDEPRPSNKDIMNWRLRQLETVSRKIADGTLPQSAYLAAVASGYQEDRKFMTIPTVCGDCPNCRPTKK